MKSVVPKNSLKKVNLMNKNAVRNSVYMFSWSYEDRLRFLLSSLNLIQAFTCTQSGLLFRTSFVPSPFVELKSICVKIKGYLLLLLLNNSASQPFSCHGSPCEYLSKDCKMRQKLFAYYRVSIKFNHKKYWRAIRACGSRVWDPLVRVWGLGRGRA